jgi:SHS2 domain-containing protein
MHRKMSTIFTKDQTKFNEIEHTADVGICANGNTIQELMANLAFGMLHIITGDIEIEATRKHSLFVESPSLVEMIVDWLSEINYLITVNHFLVTGIEIINLNQNPEHYSIRAELYGKDGAKTELWFKKEIKAVTYHQLVCEKRDEGYIGKVIFDI